MKQLNDLKRTIFEWRKVESKYNDLISLSELLKEEPDSSLENELSKELSSLKNEIENLEIQTLFSEEYDNHNAILSIHPGAGGTESQDWAQMLFRMYSRWAEQKGYKLETVDLLPGEEAGLKSVTFMISGNYAYGSLKSEKGVHRLVRISPFDANKRRHTSFASVDVIPEIEDVEIEIKSDDLKIDTFRSSGPGGQHMQKTESAIRITHIPTGIIAQCENERSQFQNKVTAMKVLRARIFERMQEENADKMEKLTGQKKEITWGSQIRSYVFQPYTIIKDHRTGIEVGNIQAVMDGEIDVFIRGYLHDKFEK
mgnify:CR=1 FL=1